MAKTKGKKQRPDDDKPRAIEKDENRAVENWRQEQIVKTLRNSGMTDESIDLDIVKTLVGKANSHHCLQTLIDKGCDPETAMRIVA